MACIALAFSLILAVEGLLLVRTARRGTPRGTTPHCSKCCYNLTGLRSERCPECGALLTERGAIVIGRRVRRPYLLVLGVILILSGLLIFTRTAARERYFRPSYWSRVWHRHKPTAWIVEDVASPSLSLSLRWRAANELLRRQAAGGLTGGDLTAVTEALLHLQAQPVVPELVGKPAIETLSRLFAAGQLSEQQTARFYENSQFVAIRTRPTLLPDRSVPIEIRSQSRTTSGIAFGELRELRVDDGVVSVGTRGWEHLFGYGGERVLAFHLPSLAPGRHRVKCTVAIGLRRRGGANNEHAPIFLGTRTLTSEFEVLAEEPAECVKRVRSADLDIAVAACFSPVRFLASNRCDSEEERIYPTLLGYIRIAGPLPVNVAFDVFAEFDGRAAPLGRITGRKGDYSFEPMVKVEGDVPYDIPQRVTILLKASEEAALDTVELFEIWGGEVRLPDVEISNYETPEQKRERHERLVEESSKRLEESRKQLEEKRRKGASSQPAAGRP